MGAVGVRRVNLRTGGGIPNGQLILLLLLLCVGGALISATIQQGRFSTVLLLGFVAIGGLALCWYTQARLNDPSLNVLGYFWLIKLGLTFFLVYVSWTPLIATDTGYDPVRYYFQAQDLIEDNWSTEAISLNYVGVLYYYGAVFYVFGHNPVSPALINAFVTLIASLYLVAVGYEIKGKKAAGDWTLAFALLLPEVLWFDIMTDRDTLVASLLLFAMLTAGRYFARLAPVSLSKVLIVVGFSSLSIAAVRTSMLLPLFASILLMMLLVGPQRGSLVTQKIIVGSVVAAALIFGQIVNLNLGGNAVNIDEALRAAVSTEANVASSEDFQYSENSISLLFMPEGLLQAILYLPLRMGLYLLAPLPNVIRPISDLLDGSVGEWQTLFTILSSVVNLLAFPYVLAGLIHATRMRKRNAAHLVFQISYWCTFMAIAGGNLIVHERYRIMATLLLWGCAWLGARTCPRHLIVVTSKLWYVLLTLATFPYLIYKFAS